ncbi:hypothetical protein FEM48_Zijuj09G0171800 [Ziziphus jujuba var. spinosa]|uniref:Transposase MuDR plant domain-containing protein n=1 Tax=Ziziphus jujuba var. spinosa TaxID=714518 RepID=A0A978UU90_ZIZJJ|nr:hypothetical protein FEM48_Zijuj09G0171800 [Ziziphus jujuba var. spinosa]
MALFTTRIWHGGHFEFTPSRQYVGGESAHFDNCDPDKWKHFEVNPLLADIEGIGDNTSRERSVDYERADLHDIHVNVVDDAAISNHCVGMVNTRDGEKLYDIDVDEDDDEDEDDHNWLQECATMADHLAACSSYGGGVRYSSLADDEAKLVDNDAASVQNDDIGATGVGLADTANEAEDAIHGPNLVGNAGQYDVIYDSDQFISLPSSSDEDEVNTHILIYSTHGANLEMHVGIKFASHIEFKEYLVNYALSGGWNIRFTKNASWRVTARCKECCPWRVHTSNMQAQETFQIKTLQEEYTCTRSLTNRFMKSKWLAKRYFNDFRENLNMKLSTFQDKVKQDLIVDIKRSQAYRARKKANSMAAGDVAEQYSRLWDYCAEIDRSNSGSTCRLKINKEFGISIFQRIYICLAACKEGFKVGCIPFIRLEGCHLNGQHGG